MDALFQNLRYAARSLRNSPGFTAVAVLTLALGIGANGAIFGVVDSVLLEPLPYGEPDRVVAVWNSFVGWEKAPLSEPELVDYREEIDGLEELAAYDGTEMNLTGGESPERVAAARVTVNLFDALGVEATVGRTFTADEREPGRTDVVVIGHGLWRRRFGGDPAIVGRTVRLDGRPRTVIGVAPASFGLPQDFRTEDPTEAWVPLGLTRGELGDRGRHSLRAVGRLRPGATLAGVNAELDAVARRWVADGIADVEGFTTFAIPVRDEAVGEVRPALLILLGAVGFVLLIACANVANLLLVRADRRRREIALRAALGAGRGRIVGQLLTESLVLAAIGGAAGLLLAYLGLEALVALDPESLPRTGGIGLDGRMLTFTGAVALLTGVGFGTLPALQASQPDLVRPLKEGGRGGAAGGGGARFRRGLVIAEVALSVVLVVGAGLMIRSFQELRRVDLGFDSENVLTLRLSLPGSEYETAEIVAFYRRLNERVESLPDIASAGAAALLPLAHGIGDWGIDIEGRTERPDENFAGYLQIATPGYFETMRIPRLRGRPIRGTDRLDGPPVVMINETMAETYWPGQSAIGRRFRLSGQGGEWFTVVGVVGDARHNAVTEEMLPVMMFPHAQLPQALGGTTAAMTLVLRTRGDPLAALAPVRETIRSMDPNLPVAEIRTMERVVGAAVSDTRFIMLLLAVFAGVALVLGAVGVYGVVAYAVSRRTRELGIRMALGAAAGDVRRHVVRQGATLVGAGVAVGLAAAFATTRVLSSMLYGVGAADPATYAVVALILGGVALLASYGPARRATRVDPMAALTME